MIPKRNSKCGVRNEPVAALVRARARNIRSEEIRKPKAEARMKTEARNPNSKSTTRLAYYSDFGLRILDFVRADSR